MSIVQVIQVSNVPECSSVIVDIDGESICLVRKHDDYYAFSAFCTHVGIPFTMDAIDLQNHCITCPLHGSVFDICTGHVLFGPAKQSLCLYSVSIQEGWICIDIPFFQRGWEQTEVTLNDYIREMI